MVKTLIQTSCLCGLLALGGNMLVGPETNTAPRSPQVEVLRANILPDKKRVEAELLVDGLINPWGMVFLPNGDLLVTEKAGSIRVIRNWKLLDQEIEGVPEVHAKRQGGLLDIALHPKFSENSLIYLSYSRLDDSGEGSNTAVLRARLDGMRLVDQKLLYKAEANTSKDVHYGSRFAFDTHGYLYFSIGDRGKRDINPQDIKRDSGKIYRIHDDGRIPKDNPFVDTPGAKTAIFSYGHRNPQGLALNPSTGEIWSHEHGPRGGDEVNRILAGRNYGWPILSYGISYGGVPFAEGTEREGMESPLTYWDPSIAPCGMTFVQGNKYPGWEGDLIVGALKFGFLLRLDVDGNTIRSHEQIAYGIGRVRNVIQGPDGFLYVGVEGQGIYRLNPR